MCIRDRINIANLDESNSNSYQTVSLDIVNEIIKARVSEILELIEKHINQTPYSHFLKSKVVFSGGRGSINLCDGLREFSKVNDVNLNLVSTSTGDDSTVKLVAGNNMTLTRDNATQVTIAAATAGVTTVSSANTDTITVANPSSTPALTAVTAAVSGSSPNLATGAQIQTAIDNALIGSVEFKGGFNAGTGAIDGGGNLTTGASRVAIAIGDLYVVTTAGSFTVMVSRPPSTSLVTTAAPSFTSISEAKVAWEKPHRAANI